MYTFWIVELKVVAQFSIDEAVRDLLEIEYEGISALLVLLTDAALIWDPRRAGLPLLEIEFQTGRHAGGVIAIPTLPNSFCVWFSGGHLTLFESLKQTSQWKLANINWDSFGVVGRQLFGCSMDGKIVQFGRAGMFRIIINREDLVEYLLGVRDAIPGISSVGSSANSIREFREFLSIFLGHISIRTMRIDNDEVLAVRFRLDISQSGNSGVVFWEPEKGFSGCWFFEGRAAEIAAFQDDTGSGMVATLLAHYNKKENLMVWARRGGGPMSRCFETVRAGVPISEDIFCLLFINNKKWFAADTSGKLFVIQNDGLYNRLPVSLGSSPTSAIMLRWQGKR